MPNLIARLAVNGPLMGALIDRIGASAIPCVSIVLSMVPMWLSPIDLQREQALSEFSESQHRGLGPQQDTLLTVQAQAAE
jgi:hypothetical protein